MVLGPGKRPRFRLPPSEGNVGHTGRKPRLSAHWVKPHQEDPAVMTYLHIRVNDVLEPQDAVWWDIHHGHLCKRDLCAANHVTESRFEWDAIYTRDAIKGRVKLAVRTVQVHTHHALSRLRSPTELPWKLLMNSPPARPVPCFKSMHEVQPARCSEETIMINEPMMFVLNAPFFRD